MELTRVDLHDVDAFLRVVEAGGFARAAERMGLAKSILSRRVSRLEARLGAKLLTRTARGVHVIVTGRGERTSLVVDRASDVLTLAGAEREAVPETVPAEIRRLVTAAHQRPRGLLLLLDLTRTLSST